jgi:hypothetical protein
MSHERGATKCGANGAVGAYDTDGGAGMKLTLTQTSAPQWLQVRIESILTSYVESSQPPDAL